MELCNEWKDLLKNEINSSKIIELKSFLQNEYKNHIVYPCKNDIFNALNDVSFDDVKIVIVGQDPYHEPGQAHGYAFSVLNGNPPPSLVNIYKEIESDIGMVNSKSGDLSDWAKQGVLLLNSVLTVREHMANSHKGKGWELLTSKIISIFNDRQKPVVFILWGGNAKSFLPLITNKRHLVLTSAHPSPLSAYNGFFGCKHFSKANEFLENNRFKKIVW